MDIDIKEKDINEILKKRDDEEYESYTKFKIILNNLVEDIYDEMIKIADGEEKYITKINIIRKSYYEELKIRILPSNAYKHFLDRIDEFIDGIED